MTLIKELMDWIKTRDFILGEFGDGQREFQGMVEDKFKELAKKDLEEFKDEDTLKFDPWIYGENCEEDLEEVTKGDDKNV